MNILMIVGAFFPMIAGECTRTYGLCRHLIKEGCQVTVLTFRHEKTWKKEEDIEGIKVIRVNMYGHGLNTIILLLKMTQLLLTKQYHILHVRDMLSVSYARIISFLLRIPMVYEIFSVSSADTAGMKRPLFKFIKRTNKIFLKWVDKVILNNPQLERYAIESGAPELKIIALPNGVDLSHFFPRNKNEEIIKKYHLENNKILMYLGKFQEYENLSELIEVFVQVRKKLNGVKLMLVGDGPDREKIERTIEKYNLAEEVIITGFVPFDETPRYYSACDVFVMVRPGIPKVENVLPIKPVEAMAMGKVIISTDIGGMREIIEDGETGFLVPHSINVIADKIIEVLNNPPLQEEIGANARKYVKENGDWKVIIKGLVRAYEEVIREHKQIK